MNIYKGGTRDYVNAISYEYNIVGRLKRSVVSGVLLELLPTVGASK